MHSYDNTTYQGWWEFLTSVHGRVPRKTFNYFMLCILIVSVLLGGMDAWRLGIHAVKSGQTSTLTGLIQLIMAWPCIVIVGRRLHDLGYSSWWQLFYHAIVAVVGVFWIAVFMLLDLRVLTGIVFVIMLLASSVFWIALSCIKGQAGENRFGSDPLMEKDVR